MHTLIQEEEPWLAGEPYTQYIRDAIRLRYALLPLFYTSFYEASKTGTPVIKPVFYENTHNADSYAIDDEFLYWKLGVISKASN